MTALLALLDLPRIEADVYAAPTGREDAGHPVLGGLLVTQSLVAAGHTVLATRRPHALHASTRQVHVEQDGRVICTVSTSFQDPEAGVEHQTPMPPHSQPAELPRVAEPPNLPGAVRRDRPRRVVRPRPTVRRL
ncbi:MAG: tesB [Marmoricola sp.]|nr:tesB [Marmoricola sp.]